MKTKQKIIGSIIVLVIIGIFFVVGTVINRPKERHINEEDIFVDINEIENKHSSDVSSGDVKFITVYINGEVDKPGVYKLKNGSIVEDLVKQAGGYTPEANVQSRLNLAKKLKDEDYVYIEKKLEPGAVSAGAVPASTGVMGNGKINLNSASLSELDKIPGIGPVTAQKIIDYREKHGAFNSIDDLKKLGGIGDKTIDKFRDIVDIR